MPSRPVKAALRAGTFHTRGRLPGSRGPLPLTRASIPGGRDGAWCGLDGPSTARNNASRAAWSSSPNTSGARRKLRIAGGVVSAIRTGVIFSRRATMAVHSGVVNRSGSKYAGENNARNRPRSSAAFIFRTKLSPAPQSQ
jgi:hypothetical protein